MKEYGDTTYDNEGRIQSPTKFRTVWTDDYVLLELFVSWNHSKEHKTDLSKLDRKEKLAITRHKKALMLKDGVIKPPTTTKMLINNYGYGFYTAYLIEKEKIFTSEDGSERYIKSDCTIWSKEKEILVKELEKTRHEAHYKSTKLMSKIMERK